MLLSGGEEAFAWVDPIGRVFQARSVERGDAISGESFPEFC